MKSSHQRFNAFHAAALAVVVAFGGPGVAAQVQDAVPREEEPRLQEPVEASPPRSGRREPPLREAGILMDLEIRSGVLFQNGAQTPATVAALAEHLRGAGMNVILSPGAEEFRITDLRLRSANAQLIAQSLRVASRETIQAEVRPGPVETIFILQRHRSPRKMEVFNVGGYYRVNQGAGIEAVEEMIHSTYSALAGGSVPDDERPEFKFHPGTRLLIVIGNDQAIEVSRKIVNALPGQLPLRRTFPPGEE